MKKNKLFKIIITILLLSTLLVFTFSTISSADFIGNIDKKFSDANSTDKSNASNEIGSFIGKMINFLQVFGAGFAIIALIVLAIRWIWASPSGKAEIAKSSRYYILGAVFIFAAIGLIHLVQLFTNSNIKNI